MQIKKPKSRYDTLKFLKENPRYIEHSLHVSIYDNKPLG